MQYKEVFRWAFVMACTLAIGACGGGGGGAVALTEGDDGGGSADAQVAITITGPATGDSMETPDESVILEGTASSTNGITAVTWTNDRGGQGEASGTSSWKTGGIKLEPGENRITVTAEDASGATASTAVVIKRESAVTGSVTLSWSAPTHREDGTPLDNLAGFNIHYGRMSGVYDYKIVIDNPGVTTYVVEGLEPGTWYFVVSAFDSAGLESNFSNEVRRIVE